MRILTALGVCVLFGAAAAPAPESGAFTLGRALFTGSFAAMDQWTAELEQPGKVEARSGVLSIDVPAGCTVWFRPELSGPVMIQYEARMVQAGGANDRVSDLNAFWMANDSRSPNDLFATKRSGKFADYNQLRTYYVGQGGNSNTTTRFRRYIGDAQERPLLPEHDLNRPEVLLRPNVWQTVQLVAVGNRIQYYRDSILIFDFTDPAPYTRGHFAFRTTKSHVELRNFAVYQVAPRQFPPVQAQQDDATIRLDNGLVALTYSKTTGTFTNIARYMDGKPRVLATGPEAYYWDCVAEPRGNVRLRNPDPLQLVATPDSAEIVATLPRSEWPAFEVEVHFVLRRGDAGFYSYAVIHHPASLGDLVMDQSRFVSKTVTDETFSEFVIGDERVKDIDRSEKQQKLMDATFLLADGTIQTKYQNSSYWAETPVYGHAGAQVGLWSITASPEYHNGGPLKQGQTVHDNVLLRVLTSSHFGAMPVHVAAGEEWTKVYGPVFTYMNTGDGPAALWADARRQQQQEASQWPYQWVTSPAYVKQRGAVSGRWKLTGEPAKTGAWVVLADRATTENPDWTLQSKGYQFWTHTGPDGQFTIPNVIPGTYTMYISGADQPVQWSRGGLAVSPGETIHLDVGWTPVRHGVTAWQIGTFDRTAAEFRNGASARDFEMFKRYPEDFPEDVTFTIGASDPAKDWNYAQWALYVKKPVWTIRFQLDSVPQGSGTLTLAFASAQPARGSRTNLEVKVNGSLIDTLYLPKTGTAGYRGSAQDSPWNVRTLTFDASLLHAGMNEITLGHADARQFPADGRITGTVGQVMYDAIRLELTGAGGVGVRD